MTIAIRLAALAALLAAAPAQADVRALAARGDFGAGPALAGDRVVWAEGTAALRISCQPLAGGPAAVSGRVPMPGRRAWAGTLVASPAGMALRLADGRLFAGLPCAQPVLAARNVPAGQRMNQGPDMWVTDAGTLTLERLRAVLRPPRGAARELPLPAGADPLFLFAAGALAAVPISDAGGPREVAVIALPSGAVVRRVALGEMRGTEIISLAIAPDGAMAVTGEGGAGQDGVAWAPAGAAQFEVVDIADNFSQVRIAGGRIAMLVAGRAGDGQRPIVLEPVPGGEPRIVFRGPPTNAIRTLDFDGRHVAWSSSGCRLVATADPTSSRDTVPAGPCVRTEVWIGTFSPPLRRRERALRVSVNCLTSPDRRCRVGLRAFDDRGRPLASRRTSVPRGTERIVHIPLGARAIARVRRGRTDPFIESRVIDPDGRSRIVSRFQ